MREPAITAAAVGFALLAHGALFAFIPAGKSQREPRFEKITIQVELPEQHPPPVESKPLAPVSVPEKALSRRVADNESQNQVLRPLERTVAKEVSPPAAPLQQSAAAQTSPEWKQVPTAIEKAVAKPRQEEVRPQSTRKPPGLSEYLSVVRAQVERNREYPAMARQMEMQGTVVVRIAIKEDGSLSAVEIISSSGYASLDKAAVSAVKRAVPFRSPGSFGLGRVTVEVPIVFRLT